MRPQRLAKSPTAEIDLAPDHSGGHLRKTQVVSGFSPVVSDWSAGAALDIHRERWERADGAGSQGRRAQHGRALATVSGSLSGVMHELPS